MSDNRKRLLSVYKRGPDKNRGCSVITTTYSDKSIKIEKRYYVR
jgi:hypothetical protein